LTRTKEGKVHATVWTIKGKEKGVAGGTTRIRKKSLD